MDKHILIALSKSLLLQLNTITSQLEFLTEQIALMSQRYLDRKAEQTDQIHLLKKEELEKLFPNVYRELTPVIYKCRSIIPQTFLVNEHRVHQYTSMDNDGRIVKARRSPDLFLNSIATPSLVVAIINGKYNNHLPLEW